MLFLRFSLLFLFSINFAMAQKFSSQECLSSNFKTEINHEGKFFGLIKNKLEIKKNHCLINIKFKNILETQWDIDICREPIHMKLTSRGSQNVYKRKGACQGESTDYCTYWRELENTIQDYGLIFAKGERENLGEDHGRTYCTFLLVRKYLKEGYLFSKYDESIDILSKEKEEAPAPVFVEPQGPEPSVEEKAEQIIEEAQPEPEASEEAGLKF